MNRLFEAIERGDAGTVWQLVQSDADLTVVDETTQLTALALAAENGRVEIVRTLLEAGADPNLGGATTPLEAAVVEGHREVVEALLEASADVNLPVADGFTPLMTAAIMDNLDLALMLLAAGARPRTENDEGRTAISLAEDAGHQALAVVLKGERWKSQPAPKPAAAGKAPRSKPPPARSAASGDAPPAPAADGERESGAEETEPAASAGPVTAEAEEAVPAGEPAAVPRPEPGPAAGETEEPEAEGRTELMAAAAAGDVEQVRRLIAAGAEIDAADRPEGGQTALVYAVRSPSPGRLRVISLLAAAGADLDRPCGRHRRTPLMYAAEADVYLEREVEPRFGETTRHLIELGASLGATDLRGHTVWRLIKRDALGAPTFSASRRRLHQMLRLLESRGARPLASRKV